MAMNDEVLSRKKKKDEEEHLSHEEQSKAEASKFFSIRGLYRIS